MLAETDLKALKDPTLFSFWSSVSVRFSDLDPNNHVNNAVTLSYIETARLGIRSAVLNELDDETKNLSWVVVAQSIAYFQPISYPSEVKIGCFESGLGRTSFQLAYGVFVNSVCHASATSRSVCIDANTGRPVVLPDVFRSQLKEFHRVLT